MSALLALTRSKTVLEMDSGWGVPVGVLMMFVVIIQLLRNNSAGESSGSNRRKEREGVVRYTPVNWQRHQEEDRIRKARLQAEYEAKSAAAKARADEALKQARAEEAVDSGNTLIQLLNETMERTGQPADQLCAIIREETKIPVYVNSSNQFTATQEQLLMLIPFLEGLKELFQGLENAKPIE